VPAGLTALQQVLPAKLIAADLGSAVVTSPTQTRSVIRHARAGAPDPQAAHPGRIRSGYVKKVPAVYLGTAAMQPANPPLALRAGIQFHGSLSRQEGSLRIHAGDQHNRNKYDRQQQ